MPRTALLCAAVAACGFALLLRAEPAAQPTRPTAQPAAQPAPVAESLDGTWELVSAIDDGKLVPLEVVRQTMIRDARVTIAGPVVTFARPDGTARTLAFVTDPKTSPKAVDLAGVTRTGGKGVYVRDGDTLMVCVAGSDTAPRPTVVASLPGSDTFLLTFRKAAARPAQPAPQPPPPPAPLAGDAAVREMLVGTWGHQTDDQVVKLALNADGTFGLTTNYKRGFKKVFDSEDRTSGKWHVKEGTVTFTPTASTEKNKVGQVYSYRIGSISAGEVIYTDAITGQRRIEWKLR